MSGQNKAGGLQLTMRKQVKQWQIGGTKSKGGGKVEWQQTRWQQVEDLRKAIGLVLVFDQRA